MSSVHAGETDSGKSLLQQLQEDADSEFVNHLMSKLGQCMEEIEVAKLNCEDAQAVSTLSGLYRAACVCDEGLRDTWSSLHLRKRA